MQYIIVDLDFHQYIPDPSDAVDAEDTVYVEPEETVDAEETVQCIIPRPTAGKEVYLLRGNNILIKVICFPFKEGVERIVHCKALNPNQERFIIK